MTMLTQPAIKHRAFAPGCMAERRRRDAVLDHLPRCCSMGLRDGFQVLPAGVGPAQALQIALAHCPMAIEETS